MLADWVLPLLSLAVAGASALVVYRRRPAALSDALTRQLDAFRTDFAKLGQGVQDQLDDFRRELKTLADEAEDLLDRARAARARADGRRGGRPPKNEGEPVAMTTEDYLRHLERGGRAIPELEARLNG